MTRTTILVACGLLALLIWQLWPALQGTFVYEDHRYLEGCGAQTWGLLGRRLMLATWCWQARHTPSPLAFHLVNLALHSGVVLLVGGLIWALTRGHRIATALGTAFVGLNAGNLEAVGYLAGRSELIAALGVLGACLAAVSHRGWWSAPLLLLGVLGKESAIVGLMLVPLCLWYRHGRIFGWLVALGGVIIVTAIAVVTRAGWWTFVPSPGHWLLLQTSALVRLIVLSIVPWHQTIDYDYERVAPMARLIAVIALLSGVAWGWRQREDHRLRWLGIVWIAAAALPRLLVPTPFDVFSEHKFYLPRVGFGFVVADWLQTSLSRSVWT